MCINLYCIILPGVTVTLAGEDVAANNSILITDVNPTNSEDANQALICLSELTAEETLFENGDWYLHPTQQSTEDGDRIQHFDSRGWHRNRFSPNRQRGVRLFRVSQIAVEGVFTCHIPGDINTPVSVGIYYHSEFHCNFL